MENPFSSRSGTSIKSRVYLILGVFLLFMCLVEASIFYNWFQARKEMELRANLELARSVAKIFEVWVEDLNRDLALIGEAFAALPRGFGTDRGRLLDIAKENTPAARSVYWMNPEGIVTASSLRSYTGLDLSDRSYFRKVSEGQDWFISELVIGRVTGKPAFTICRGIRSETGELLGVMAASIEPDAFEEILKGVRTPSTAGMGIVDSKGMLVYRSPPGIDFTWEERNWLRTFPILGEVLQGREVTTTITVKKPNVHSRLSAIAPVSGLGWAVSCARAEDEVNAAIVNILLPHAMLTLLLTALVIAIAAGLSRPIIQSIIKNAEHVNAIGRGELGKVASDGPSELRALSDTLNDMADRIRSRETALRESEDRLRSLGDDLPDAAVYQYVREDDGHVHFTYVSAGIERLNGVKIQDVLRDAGTLHRQILPEYFPSLVEEETRCLKDLSDFSMDVPMRRSDGELRWMRLRSRPRRLPDGKIVWDGVQVDVTERKLAENALRDSEERFRALVTASSDVVYRMNPDWTEMRHLLGRDFIADTEAPSRTWFQEYIPAKDQPRVLEAIKEAIRTKSIFELEHQVLRANGSLGWTFSRAVPLLDSNGEIVEWFGAASDITNRKDAEQALRLLNESLESKVKERTADLHAAYKGLEDRAAQLRALAGELTTAEQRERRSIAKLLHDGLQQFLVAARMRQNALIGELGNHAAKQSAQEVEGLLAESINVSRTLATELCPPALDGGICSGLEWLSRFMASKHGLNVNLVMETTGVTLPEDIRIFLFESIRELLLNVVKHSTTLDAKVLLKGEQQRLCVTVSDSGAGFDVSALTKEGGQGFGLFSIRERIGLVGGNIAIDSSPGTGARFILSVPLAKDGSTQATPVPPCEIRTATGVVDGRIRILLADDHSVIRESLAQMLGAEDDFEIVGQARDGNMAVELVHALQPNVVLMDIGMPNMDGVTATRIIAQRDPGVHVIGLSFYRAEERADEMIQAGAALYVSKTAPADELKRVIRSCVGSNSAKDQAA